MDKDVVLKELVALSNKLSKSNKKISLVIYCVAEALKSGEDIFSAIDKLKDQISIAESMESILK